jgi:hypothetical protein
MRTIATNQCEHTGALREVRACGSTTATTVVGSLPLPWWLRSMHREASFIFLALYNISMLAWFIFFLVLMVVCSFDFPLEPTELFSFYALISLQNSKIVDKTIRRTNMLFTIIVLHYFHSKYSGAVLVRGQGGMNFSCKEYYPTYKKS